jgi:hypothetical protein
LISGAIHEERSWMNKKDFITNAVSFKRVITCLMIYCEALKRYPKSTVHWIQ